MKPRAKRIGTVLLLLFAVTASSQACRTATQVELVVTYDGQCPDLDGVAFIVGTDPYVAEKRIDSNLFTTTTAQCTPGRVGTLVVTPSDATERAAVIVIAAFQGKRVEDCKAVDGYAGCIVARRSFAFVDHTALTLEIALERLCKDVPCDAVSTCKRAVCVASNVSCSSDGCSSPGQLGDGGLATVDAPTSSDAYVQEHEAGPPGMDAATEAGMDASPVSDASTCPTNTPTECLPGSAACGAGHACCQDMSGVGPFACRTTCPLGYSSRLDCTTTSNCSGGFVCCIAPFVSSPRAQCVSPATCAGQSNFKRLCRTDCECKGATGVSDGGSTHCLPYASDISNLSACQ